MLGSEAVERFYILVFFKIMRVVLVSHGGRTLLILFTSIKQRSCSKVLQVQVLYCNTLSNDNINHAIMVILLSFS